MAKLPTKVRVDIRDLWDAPGSAVQQSVDSLYKTLGRKIYPEVVEWPAQWANLKDHFPDLEGFVPALIAISTAWYDHLTTRLENPAYSKWAEEFLDVLSEASKSRQPNCRLYIQVAEPSKILRPTTHWDSKLSSFVLKIPSCQPVSLDRMIAGYDKDFENLFTEGQTAEGDEWAHVDGHELETASAYPTRTVDCLPTLDMLLCPADLFKITTPYILLVEIKNNSIAVQCSHEPSLELLASYLKKWEKKIPVYLGGLTIELHNSDYCFGMMDCLTIKPNDPHKPANPALVIAFIEGILRYKLIHTTGYHWVYRSKSS